MTHLAPITRHSKSLNPPNIPLTTPQIPNPPSRPPNPIRRLRTNPPTNRARHIIHRNQPPLLTPKTATHATTPLHQPCQRHLNHPPPNPRPITLPPQPLREDAKAPLGKTADDGETDGMGALGVEGGVVQGPGVPKRVDGGGEAFCGEAVGLFDEGAGIEGAPDGTVAVGGEGGVRDCCIIKGSNEVLWWW